MKSGIVAVIPYLSTYWMLQDCLDSMGDTDIPVIVVDNSKDAEVVADAENLPKNVRVYRHPSNCNIGISAAWNVGLQENVEQCLIVSQSVRFAPAELSRRTEKMGLNWIAKNIEEKASPFGLTFGDQGFHLISIGRATIERIGYFDENFLAYGEDDDYKHRMDLAGIVMPDWGDYRESNVQSIAFAVQKRNGAIKTDTASRIKEYFNFKWCSSPDMHPGDYQHPFNDHTKGLDFWPEVRHR